MIAFYAEAWKRCCMTTDARFVALEVRRWFNRPRITILYPAMGNSQLFEEMEKLQRSLLIPREYLFMNEEQSLNYSATTVVASIQK